MTTGAWIILFLVVYVLATRWLLPKLGVST